MHRKNFIKQCGFACMGAIAASGWMQSCIASKAVTGKISGDDIIVALSDFKMEGTNTSFKKYLIVHNDILKFPICVYRHNENSFSALWMQCTHQGAELQVFGDKLQCPAHGSEFSNQGQVESGPAEKALRSFPVTVGKKELKISLKAI
jgi:Rieske Fe-S protein